jgi:spore coat protein CotF
MFICLYVGCDLTNVQYKPNQNCHYKSSLYNEYILIEKFTIKKKYPHLNTHTEQVVSTSILILI